MSFDITEWCEDHLDGVRPSKGGVELTSVCPWCNKYGGFYVNAESGAFVCFKCRDEQPSQGKAIYPLVAHVEGITIEQARARALRGLSFARRKMPRATLLDHIRALRGKEAIEEQADVCAPLPRKVIPCFSEKRKRQWMVPRYLKRQYGIERETVAKFGLGYIDGKCWYPEDAESDEQMQVGDRIFIPIRCPSGESWTARDYTGRGFPKYLNPPNIDNRRLLLGWEHVKVGGDIVLVEGPMDAIKMHQHGLPALALLGKNLSKEQLALLSRWPPDSAITIMLDPEEEIAPVEVAIQLQVRFKRVYIAKLPDDVDPGSSTPEQAKRAYDRSKQFKGGRVARLAAKMGLGWSLGK